MARAAFVALALCTQQNPKGRGEQLSPGLVLFHTSEQCSITGALLEHAAWCSFLTTLHWPVLGDLSPSKHCNMHSLCCWCGACCHAMVRRTFIIGWSCYRILAAMLPLYLTFFHTAHVVGVLVPCKSPGSQVFHGT
jgi:hypothetical protein